MTLSKPVICLCLFPLDALNMWHLPQSCACASWEKPVTHVNKVFSAFRTLSFVDNTVAQEAKSKQICHDDLIPPLSINLLKQELHALCQVANRHRSNELRDAVLLCHSCILMTHCIKLLHPWASQNHPSGELLSLRQFQNSYYMHD